MSSRFPTRSLSRSASTSIVSSRARACSSVKDTSSDSRLDADALIDASGVRRSWLTAREQGRAQLVALHQRLGGGGLRLEPLALERDGELGGEGAEHGPIGARAGPDRRARSSTPSVSGSSISSESVRPVPAPASATISGAGSLRTTAAWSSRNSATRLARSSGIGSPLRSSEPAMPASASASLRARFASAAAGRPRRRGCSRRPRRP